METIIITGSVCTGKTALAKIIAEKLGFQYFDLNTLIKKNKIYDSYDKSDKCYIVDQKKLSKFLNEFFQKKLEGIQKIKHNKIKIKKLKKNHTSYVLDGHLSHYLTPKIADLCIVTKCDIKVLNKRLNKRGYSKKKVKDNLEAEIFDVCFTEAKELGHNIITIDTTKDFKIDKAIKQIKERIKNC